MKSQFIDMRRPLTWEEYRAVKFLDWREQSAVFINHLTKEGFEEYRGSIPSGERSKFPLYNRLYLKYNSKLGKVLR